MTMTVVPTGGKLTVPLLGCGPTEWRTAPGDDVGVDPPDLVAVDAADTDVAGPAEPDDPLLAMAVLEAPAPPPAAEAEPDDPPHAVSSSTSAPSPVAAAHPLLRITSTPFTGMTRSRSSPSRSEPEVLRAFPGRHG